MASVNRVMILGNLGQDPELRYTPSQVPVATLNVATSENWTRDGQKQEQTEWHRIIVWNKQAELCAKYLTKGRTVFVEGRLQTRAWEDKTGQKRYTTEIVAQNIQFIGGANQGANINSGDNASRQPGSALGGSYDFGAGAMGNSSSMSGGRAAPSDTYGFGSGGGKGIEFDASHLDDVPF